jgi:hypothetical protein
MEENREWGRGIGECFFINVMKIIQTTRWKTIGSGWGVGVVGKKQSKIPDISVACLRRSNQQIHLLQGKLQRNEVFTVFSKKSEIPLPFILTYYL